MKKEQALRILRENLEEIKTFDVVSLAIFGSVARDEATETSDIDILVEFHPDAAVGLFEFFSLRRFLEGILGCEVDLGTFDSLRSEYREVVFREMIRAAWRSTIANF